MWRTRGTWRIPAFVATAVVLLVGVVAAVRADSHQLTATEATSSAFDSITGYRDAAQVVAAVPRDGQKLGAWQSGAFGFYANDRFTVVNLDGVVNPDSADATTDGTLPEYIRAQDLDWVADFALRIAGFTLGDAKQLQPAPTVTPVNDLPQFPPFPDYAMAGITWPRR